MDKEVSIERLEHLITVLEDVARERKNFDMNSWALSVEQVLEMGNGGVAPVIHEPCGTAACALGYAAMDPKFMGLGLRLEVAERDEHGVLKKHFLYNPEEHAKVSISHADVVLLDSKGNCEEWGFAAAMDFFGINRSNARYLFDPEYYLPEDEDEDDDEEPVETVTVGPEQVIARVREVIAEVRAK